MSGHAYAISAQISERLGPFTGHKLNEKHFLNVIGMHRAHAYKIGQSGVQKSILESARKSWDEALSLGERHGFKNAEISVIGPTWPIAFMIHCYTTGSAAGIELVKLKWRARGVGIRIVN